jgi:WD40 repeat protein
MEEALKAEIESLKVALNREQKARLRLEEECDLLAEDNERLRALVPHSTSTNAAAPPLPPLSTTTTSTAATVDLDFFTEDRDSYCAKSLFKSIANANGGKNVLSTAFLPAQNLVFSGGVDASLRGYDLSTGEEHVCQSVTAPVLTMACSDSRVAAGMMDGSLAVVSDSLSPLRSLKVINI